MPQLGSPESQQFTPEDRGAIRQWIQAIRSGSGPEPEPFPQGPFEAIEKCINCHGLLGDSQKVGVPYLAEQNEPYLRAQLADFKSGKRPDLVLDSMGAIVSVLTEEEINLVVKYYSRLRSQPPFPQQEIPDLEKKLARGEELSEQMACTGCHAAINNRAAMPQWPNLAGQKRDYIFNQLRAFRDGQRPGATMPGLLESQDPPFSDEDLDSMAIYFSRLGLTPQ